jgi:hypothetical protein
MSTPSVLEYARFHGLAVENAAQDVLACLSGLVSDCKRDELDASLPDPDFSACRHDVKESKLQLSREASHILANSIRDPCQIIPWDDLLPKRHSMDNLKLEEPLLATDHETDVWNFQRSAARCLDLETFMVHCTPKESNPREDFQDEWNDILSGRSLEELKTQLKREKVHATRDTLIYTTQILKDNMAGERDEALTAGFGLNKVNHATNAYFRW